MKLEIRKGTPEDLDLLIRFLQEVREKMPRKEWLYLDDPEEFRRLMGDGIMQLWFAMDADRVAAAFDILIPGLHAFNYGYDLGFDEAMLLRVVNMDTVAVHPDYLGRGLQKRLMQEAERQLAQSRPRILLCTVHPDNCYSLNNIMDLGYRMEGVLPKYGSVRCLLRKDIL